MPPNNTSKWSRRKILVLYLLPVILVSFIGIFVIQEQLALLAWTTRTSIASSSFAVQQQLHNRSIVGTQASQDVIQDRSLDDDSKNQTNIQLLQPETRKNATIVLQLSGEMGNNLGKFAYGYGLQLLLQEEFQLNTELWLRHQIGVTKWKRARSSLQRCFPLFQNMDFEKANTEEFLDAKAIKDEWLGPDVHSKIMSGKPKEVSLELKKFVELFTSDSQPNGTYSNSSISMPFLYADRMVGYDHWLERYYEKYRELFRFDYDNQPTCCHPDIKIDPDESVFHLRNFKEEMPRLYKELGFQELGPNQVANELFGHLMPGEKVVIITRSFGDNTDINRYVKAMEKRGLIVRVFTENSGVQDFCILLTAQKEIVGTSKSTFLRWSGILGNAKKVRVYSVDSPERRRRAETGRLAGGIFAKYDFQHPVLKDRFVFELYKANATLDPGW